MLSNFFMGAVVLNSYVASDDYENPIKYFQDTVGIQVSKAFIKECIFVLQIILLYQIMDGF